MEYNWKNNILAYAKWSNAYRSGGVHTRSSDLTPFNPENVETFEIGLKSEWWHQLIRINAALFSTDYNNMFIDFLNPDNLLLTETINAANKVEVDGGELDLTLLAMESFKIGISYTYLSGNMPLQPNPYNNGELEVFNLTQTPRHTGSLTLDYRFPPLPIGNFVGHLDITSSSSYHHWSTGTGHLDSYAVANGHLMLTDVPIGNGRGTLNVSLWGRNLTNEEYAIFSLDLGVAVMHTYNTPRTAGISFSYNY